MTVPTSSGQTDSYPDLVSMLRSWYQDPMWQNLNLFPWIGDEWALRLSEVYTRLEMETFTGKLHERHTKSLGDYRELFIDITPEGTRILVKGDPGIGKTTFTHKIAYDWATGNLPQFDVVLVLKLKFSNKHQTIESMVVDQLKSISDNPGSIASEAEVRNYLTSGKDKVLLVLDGLDEIKLKEFPHVQKVLRGEAYRRCCILATTRPHVAASFHNKATSVAKILGFSEEKAEEFASYIISDESERKQFFQQIHERNMSEMASVPILLQALALLYSENKRLPETLKTTYDDLVFYLRKTCEDSKRLTEDEIRAAVDEINELAFRGLMREDKQLVFSRDEIQNENILKLGLLAAEKSGSGFKPTTVLYFLHLTLQEYCAADHVTKGIVNGNRRPWEALVQDLQKPWEPYVELSNRKDTSVDFVDKTNEKTSCDLDHVNTSSTEARKTKTTVRANYKHKVDVVDSLMRTIEPRFALIQSKWSEVGSVLRKIDPRFMKNDSRHMNASLLRKMNSLQMKNDWWLGGFRPFTLTYSVTLKYLLEKLCEPLFIFLIGKLPLNKLELIIAGITELIFTHCAHATSPTGSMLYLHNIREGIEKLIKEIRPQTDSTEIDEILMQNPALIDLTAPLRDSYSHLESVARQPKFAALRVTGTGGEDDSNFLRCVNRILKTLSNIHSLELDDLPLVTDADVGVEFIDALCRSSIVSLELFDLDPLVTKVLLEKLPESVSYVSISQDNVQPEPYRLRTATDLLTLSLESCAIDLSQASFPNLRQLFFDGISAAPENNANALVDAMSSMVNLEYFGMYRCRSVFLGPLVVELLQQSKLRYAMLVDCNLSADDGELILESIQDGKLDHIDSLRLFGHSELRGQEQRFTQLCREHVIEHQISAETRFDISTIFKSASQRDQQEQIADYQQYGHDGTSLVTLATGIIRKQVEEFSISNMTPEQLKAEMSGLSNMTPEDMQAVVTHMTPEQMQAGMAGFSNITPEEIQAATTGLFNMTPEQMQAMMTRFSNMTPEQMQAMMTPFSNMTPELMQAIMTRFSNMTPELMQAMMTRFSNITPEQIQAATTGLFNMTPEQMQAMMTRFSNMTPEEIQAGMTGFCNMTPELMQAMMTCFSNMTPELMQAMMTRFSNITPEQIQAGTTGFSNITPEQMQAMMTRFSNMTPEQMQAMMTRFSNITPEQIQAATTGFSNITPEQMQAATTRRLSNMTPEQMQAAGTHLSNMTPEQIQAATTGLFNMTPEEMQAATTGLFNMTPEQMQAGMTGFSSITPEEMQDVTTDFSNMTPKQVQAAVTGFSNMTPELMRTVMTGLSNTTTGQTQIMTPFLSTTDQDQSSSRPRQDTATSEALEPRRASGATGMDNSVTQEQEGNEMAQTMTSEVLEPRGTLVATGADNSVTQERERNHVKEVMAAFVSDFFENKSIFTGQPETLPKKAPQFLLDFSSVRNLVHTFFDTDNKAKQDEPQDSTQNSQRPSEEQGEELEKDDNRSSSTVPSLQNISQGIILFT